MWTTLKKSLSRENVPNSSGREVFTKNGTPNQIMFTLLSGPSTRENDILCLTFLEYYQRYCSTEELFALLIQFFWMKEVINPTKFEFSVIFLIESKKRVSGFVKVWVNSYFQRDFCKFKGGRYRTCKVFQKLLQLIELMEEGKFQIEANDLKLTILKKHSLLVKRPMSARFRIVESASTELGTKGIFQLWKPKKVAEQLTIIEFELFRKIELQEFYNKGWSRENKEDSPNITRMIQRSNEVSLWVATLLVTQKESSVRLDLFKQFLAVAQWCLSFHNYNTTMEIIGGLSMWVVERLVPTQKLSKKLKTLWLLIKKVMDPYRNFSNYRMTLKKCKTGVLPYLGVFLKDITFIEDGNSDFCDGSINFEKMTLLSEQLAEIDRHQQTDYIKQFDEVIPELRQKLFNLEFCVEEKLEECSLLMEPLRNSLEESPLSDDDSATDLFVSRFEFEEFNEE